MFKNIVTDIRNHNQGGGFFAQGFWALAIYRFGRWRYKIRIKLFRIPFSFVYKVLFKLVQIATGIELPCEAKIGKNFRIDHFGNIIISGYSSFGDNCRIRSGVNIGLKYVDRPCAPKIGSNVDIGAGAKILGDIKVGNNVIIGANAVVVKDVPDNCIVGGVPAKIIRKISVKKPV